MSERNIYDTPEDRILLRTEDVYQTEAEDYIALYSDRLLAIVADFKNSGRPEGFNAQSMVGKSKRGEVACRLFARIDPDTGIIEAAGFKARGCLAMTACASAACMLIEGKPIEEALEITLDDITEFVDGVPTSKLHTPHFAACAIRALVGDFLIRDGASLAQLEEAVPCDPDSISCIMAEHCSYRQSLLEIRMEEAERQKRIAENNALAECMDLIRENTRHGKLTKPSDWEHLRPEHMGVKRFNACVLGSLEAESDAGDGNGEGTTANGANPHAKPSRFASRGVGIPNVFKKSANADVVQSPHDVDMVQASHDVNAPQSVRDSEVAFAAEADSAPIASVTDSVPEGKAAADDAEAALVIEAETVPQSQNDTQLMTPKSVLDDIPHVFDYSHTMPSEDDEDFELVPPEGYKLVQVDGVWGLVKTDEPPKPKELTPDAAGIKSIQFGDETYVFDGSQMTDTFARWAYLGEKDDALMTFAVCIREESRIYPRPMLESSFQNDPLNMSVDEVREAWKQAQAISDYADIHQTQASNGDIYYYSTEYLTDDYAQSLAEWYSVGRFMNV